MRVCRCCFATLLQNERPCSPFGSTNLSQWQVWGSQVLMPSLRTTATLIASSSRQRPIAVISHACSQSLECRDAAAKSLPLSLLSISLLWMSWNIVDVIGPSHAFWMCCNASTGGSTDNRDFHMMSEFVKAESVMFWNRVGKMASWSARVKAADANKAEGASFVALLIPNPPFLTGSVACCHWSTFKMLMRASLRDVSNSSSSGLPLHSQVHSVFSNFGILIKFLRRVRASC